MRITNVTITVPQSFSPKSAFSTEINSYNLLRFTIYGTLQINQTYFLISNNTLIQNT